MAYCQTWEARCYSNGIPDDVPKKLADSGRAPSYKSIAIALLKNDYAMLSLGFAPVESEYYHQLKAEKRRQKSDQIEMQI